MKLGAALTAIGLGVGFAALAATTQGCSSDAEEPTASAGKVPPAEEGSPTTSTEERVFALDALHLGEADRSGNKNPNAWKSYGYNLDGLTTNVSDKNSPDLGKVCKRASGAPATVHQDGDEGIDNAFGKEILKLLDPFTPTPSKTVTDTIKAGDFTIMLKVVGLTDEPDQTNTGLSGTLLVGTKFTEDGSATPTFTTADDWPYLPEPQVPIAGAYINKGMFVNGKNAVVKLSIAIEGKSLDLAINKAAITFKHNAASKSLEDGTIAGILKTQELLDALSSVAGNFSPDLCSGSTIEGIKDSIRQASDIMADGSQDPSKDCDGISIGIGFTAKQVGAPTKVVEPGPPGPDACAEPAAQ